MRIVFDATMERLYPLAREGFSGGSQVYIKAIIKGLVQKGHTVHVIAPDLEVDEQRGPTEWWWPPAYHPREFDIAIMQMHINPDPHYDAPILVLMTSCVDPIIGDFGPHIDAVPCFSEVHQRLLLQMRPMIAPEKCYLTGLGVDLADYEHPEGCYLPAFLAPTSQDTWRTSMKVPGRMLYANDPARGLFYVLDIFDLVRQKVPYATLHVAYDFDTQLSWRAWEHSQMAQLLWDCKRRLESTPGVVNLGELTREQIIREELETQVHCMPSDPPGLGTQTHGITQAECAAAGAALVLSDVEAFPEVFGEGAILLPTIGRYLPEVQRRVTAADYAEVVVELMTDAEKWQEASRKARALAETMTWGRVVDRWEEMLQDLRKKVQG